MFFFQVRQEESEAALIRESARVKELSKQLTQVQELLYAATKEHLETKMATRQTETKWIHEKDRLMRELDHLKDKLATSQHRKVSIVLQYVQQLFICSKLRQFRM